MITKEKKAFTLIELLIAVGILAMVLVFASTIFRVSIDAYRTATAQAEIMQKFRALTDQLNADFAGLRKDAPLLMQFRQGNLPDPNRYDQMMFFADGDFQSVQSYNENTRIPDPDGDIFVRGNIARVHYGQARVNRNLPWELENELRILAIRRHILTADARLADWPNADDIDGSFNDPDDIALRQRRNNERYEHDKLPLSRWKTINRDTYNEAGSIINTCFGWRPEIVLDDLDDTTTFHKLVCDGLSSFSIQWAYWDDDITDRRFYWFPSGDPDGSGTYSHFALNSSNLFGVYFNIPEPGTITNWHAIDDEQVVFKNGEQFDAEFFPKAIKFTFRIHDSKGIIANGQEFTHIVYLDE